MAELEDLRDRRLGWTVDVRRKREFDIHEHGRRVGKLSRPSICRGRYGGECAGVRWQIQIVLRRVRWTELVGFAEGGYGLGEGRRRAREYEATVDGAAYRLVREEERGVWRDEGGFVVASFAYEANPRMELRWIRNGRIRVFTACVIPHAPVLVLLGLHQIVYGGFFTSSYGGGLDFSGLFAGGFDW